MNSMTGFGRGQSEDGLYSFTVEIKSVNHRYLDFNIRTPRFLIYLEDYIRSEVKKYLTRGRVDIFVNYVERAGKKGNLSVSLETAKAYLQAASKIRAEIKVKNDLTLSNLMHMEGVLSFEEEEEDGEKLKAILEKALQDALLSITLARKSEGKRIAEDLLQRKEELGSLLAGIEEQEPLVVEEYREKLRQKVEEYLGSQGLADENRFNAEILYFTDKASITEEIVRIKSHLKELQELLLKDEATGRALDFLVQELNREFNTIGSKCSDIAITKAVLAAKAGIEKIREQVQNIE